MAQVNGGGIVGRCCGGQQCHRREKHKQRNSDDSEGLVFQPVSEGSAGHAA